VNTNTRGEITYVTRLGSQSVSTINREVNIQPSINFGASGSIQSLINYSIVGYPYEPNYIIRLYRYGDPENMSGRCTQIRAQSLIRLVNTPQIKIDTDSIKRTPSFISRVSFIPFHDPLIDYTNIF